jgi:hypothetical protein
MHLINAMKHKNKIRVLSNSKRDTWFALGLMLYTGILFLALIVVLFEAPVK